MKRIFTLIFFTLTLKSFSQQPIFATISGGDLYSFDLMNCTRHFIGSTGQGFGDIAFTPNGELWGIKNQELFHIDTATANVTLIGNYGIGGVSLVGLDDTTLLAESDMKLFGIRTTNALSFYIDTIGHAASGDLTWYDDDLYIVTSGGQLIKIILNNTYTAIDSISEIGNLIPTCEGAVTSSFIGNYNSIVGFNGPDALKICQIDGSYQMLCPNINFPGTPGAASIRLVTQNPQPTVCGLTSEEELLIDNELSIFPNPVSTELIIRKKHGNNCNYKVYNNLGLVLKVGILFTDITSICTTDLMNGVYIIEYTNKMKSERQLFIVSK